MTRAGRNLQSRSVFWLDSALLLAVALATAMYVVTVLVGGVRGEYLNQPAVLALPLGALLARWRPGLGWLAVIFSMVLTSTLLFILAVAPLYPDGFVSVDHPNGDLTRLGEFRPAFALHLAAILLTMGTATVYARRVTGHRLALWLGLALAAATLVVGAVTLVNGDWVTYEILVTLPVNPWAFSWPVYALLAVPALWWLAGVSKRVRQEANIAPRADRLPVIRNAILSEVWPTFARAQTSGASAERARLATELHASVFPAIRSAVQSAETWGAESSDVHARLSELETELRRIADGKRNILLDEFGLVAAIEWLVERAQQDHGVPVALEVDGDVDPGRPPRPIEQVAFDICRLAIDNAVHHANPQKISVSVTVAPRHLLMEISDDGRGLNPDDVDSARRAGRRGIPDMLAAARSVSARLVVEPADGTGTRVLFEWGRG